MRSLQRRYRPGAVLVIRVTQPDRIGKTMRMRLLRGARVRLDGCLMPGKSKAVRCPAASRLPVALALIVLAFALRGRASGCRVRRRGEHAGHGPRRGCAGAGATPAPRPRGSRWPSRAPPRCPTCPTARMPAPPAPRRPAARPAAPAATTPAATPEPRSAARETAAPAPATPQPATPRSRPPRRRDARRLRQLRHLG